MNLLSCRPVFTVFPIQVAKFTKKEMFNLYVDTKVQENIGDV